MSDSNSENAGTSGRFTEPSEDVKRRNLITGIIIAAIIFGMIALAMFVRVHGS